MWSQDQKWIKNESLKNLKLVNTVITMLNTNSTISVDVQFTLNSGLTGFSKTKIVNNSIYWEVITGLIKLNVI